MGIIFIFSNLFSAIEDIHDQYQGSTIIGNTTVAENASSILTRFIPEVHNDLVFDFFGLVRSNFLVCTFSSNFCRLVYEYKLATGPILDLYEAMSLDLNPFGDFDRKYIANHKRIFANEESLNFQKGDTIYVHKTKNQDPKRNYGTLKIGGGDHKYFLRSSVTKVLYSSDLYP